MITFENLSKRYGRFTAVDGISFTVPAGTVTGFLGPNGAGKSTALRALVGLTPPSSGGATIGGRRYADLPNPGARVGVMLDAAAQHGGRTGREVLTLAALHVGVPRTRVEELTALVGLTEDEAGRRVRAYSLGMRQRLGLAVALVGSPEILVLDEPANGLDPQGIHWMRQLLRGFAAAGGTVLLSSHLLGEVQAVADDIVIIGNGRIVAQGHTQDLLGRGGTVVAARDLARLAAALTGAGVEVAGHDDALLADAPVEQVGQVALAAGIPLTQLRSGGTDGLEDMFLALTHDHAREQSRDPKAA